MAIAAVLEAHVRSAEAHQCEHHVSAHGYWRPCTHTTRIKAVVEYDDGAISELWLCSSCIADIREETEEPEPRRSWRRLHRLSALTLLLVLAIFLARPAAAEDYDYQFCDTVAGIEICVIGTMPEEALWMSTWNDEMRESYSSNGGMRLFSYMSAEGKEFERLNGDWVIAHLFLPADSGFTMPAGSQFGFEYRLGTIWSTETVVVDSPEQRIVYSTKTEALCLQAPGRDLEKKVTAAGLYDAYRSWRSSEFSKARNGAYVVFIRFPLGTLGRRGCDLTRCKVDVPRRVHFRNEGRE